MSERARDHEQKKVLPAITVAPLTSSHGLLQRTCACGGTAGIDSECEECRSKRLSSQRQFTPMTLQTKLTVNKPGDRYEQEADQVAGRLMGVSQPETLYKKQSAKAEPQIQDITKNIDLANSQELIQTPLIQRRISSTITKRIEQYDEIIDRIATEEGIHPNWVRGVIATESGGQASQSAGSGYTGLMQAERGAAQTDPETSIRAGVKKLKAFQTSLGRFLKKHNQDIHNLNDDQIIRLVMVAYNSGPGTLQKAMLYAIASGDIKRWMEPENFQRALIFYGAYSIKDALPSAMRGLEGDTLAAELAKLTGANQETIRTQYFVGNKWNKRGLQQALVQYVDNERRQLRRKDLTLAQVRAQASHWLLQTIEFKHNNLQNWYVDRVLEYKAHYDQVRPVEYIQFTENEEVPETQVVEERSEAAPQPLKMPETDVIGEHSGELRVQPNKMEGNNPAPQVLQRRTDVSTRNVLLSNNSLSSVHNILNSPGQPLDIATRSFMEPRFGHDFSNVRVHTDVKAAESARALNALAYTVGRDVVFGTGQYAPGTSVGMKLMAHELTHVVQQRESVDKPGNLELGQAHNSAESEARNMSSAIFTNRLMPSVMSKLNGSVLQRTSVSDVETDDIKSTYQVPQWQNLPKYAQDDLGLSPRNYNQGWFEKNSPELRLTVLNLYVKLKGLGLWRFVGGDSGSTSQGALEFTCSDIKGLKNTLRSRDDFTSPEGDEQEWSSREMRTSGQLHFKHFKDAGTTVQVHIDQIGLIPKNKWERVLVPVIGIAHLITYESYKDVYGIRDILLRQGWDRKPLIGEKPARMMKERPHQSRSGTEESLPF
jgi:Domain of unknown function (DUF4157)/Transglycosylase SLT domain